MGSQKITFTCIDCGKERTINIESKPDDNICIYCKRKKGVLKIPEGKKVCAVCGKTKPYSEFSRRTSSKDGFERECKSCSKERKKAWDKKNPNYKAPGREKITFRCTKCNKERKVNISSKPKDNVCGYCKAMETNKKKYGYETNLMKARDLALLNEKSNKKICSLCKVEKDLSEFTKNISKKDGVDSICLSCNRKKTMDYYIKHPDKKVEVDKRFNDNHKEEIKEKAKRRYELTRDTKLSNMRQYYIENSEEIKNKVKEYRKTDKGKLVKIASSSKRRAKCQETDITSSFLESLKKNTTHCELCGEKIVVYHLDHIIPLSIGGPHIQANVRYICDKCNITRPKDGRDILSYKELDSSYNKEMRDREFYHIINNSGGYNKTPYSNRIVLTYQPHFYEVEKKLWEKEDIRRYIYENRMKYIHKRPDKLTDIEILRGFKISGKHYGFSHFSPYWIKAFIEQFGIDSIYDPCGGWGHRLLGAWGIQYYYNDVDKRTVQGVQNIFEEYKSYNKKEKLFFNEDASSFSPDLKYDAVFTCPPYFDLEKYTNDNTSTAIYKTYYDWINIWWRNLVKNCNPTKYFAFVISNSLSRDMGEIMQSEGYELFKSIPLGKKKSHYTTGNNIELLHIYNRRSN